jgi:hypothetical protein
MMTQLLKVRAKNTPRSFSKNFLMVTGDLDEEQQRVGQLEDLCGVRSLRELC